MTVYNNDFYRQRLQHLIDKVFNGNVTKAAQAIGVSTNNYLNRYLYPDEKPANKQFGMDLLKKIQAAFPDWEDGEFDNYALVPHWNVRARGGFGAHVRDDARIIRHMGFDLTFLRKLPTKYTALENIFVCEYFGSSMDDTLIEGDLMLLDSGVNEVKQDGIYMLSRPAPDNDLLIKRCTLILPNGFEISSDNKKTAPQTYIVNHKTNEHERPSVVARLLYNWRGISL